MFAVKKFDPGVVTATVNGVKDWCPCLTAEDVRKGFSELCQAMAFSILPDQNNEKIVELWFSCWSNLLSLNGKIFYVSCATICAIVLPFRLNY